MFTVAIIPNFPIWAACRAEPVLREQPLVVASRGKCLACSPELSALGCQAGDTVARAQALHSHVIVRPASGIFWQHSWNEAIELLNTYTPWIEPIELGRAIMQLESDSPHAEAQAGELSLALQACLGQGASRNMATLAAASLNDAGLVRLPAGQEERFLNSTPSWVLHKFGVEVNELERMQWLGLTSLGHLARLTRGQLAAQFVAGEFIFALLHESDTTPVATYTPPPAIVVSRSLEEEQPDALNLAQELHRLCQEAWPKLQGASPTTITVTFVTDRNRHQAQRFVKNKLTTGRNLGDLAKAVWQAACRQADCERETSKPSAGDASAITLEPGESPILLELRLGDVRPAQRLQESLFAERPSPEKVLRELNRRFPGKMLHVVRLIPWSIVPEEAAFLEPLSFSEEE